MVAIIGVLVCLGCVLTGFMMAGGSIGSLIHPSELVTIGGASLGALIVMSPIKVLKDLFKAVMITLKGSPYNKTMYTELFKVSYELLRAARRDGLLSLDKHLNEPHTSLIFGKYTRFAKDHHAMTFLCDGLAPIVDGSVTAEQLPALLETELRVMEEEHHAPTGVLQKTADALPGFGIVAAVLGIVVTMQAIDGPVEEIGHKVGAALVGTFLGVLLSYGIFAPLAARMEFVGHSELAFFRTIASIIQSFASECSPKVAIEQARRGVGTEARPGRAQLEDLFKDVEAT